MKCEEYRELFSDANFSFKKKSSIIRNTEECIYSDFIDGELSEKQIEDFRNHLKSCKACREELEKFRQSQTLLKLIPKKEAPPELWGMIEMRVRLREGELVSFYQSVGIFERLGLEEEPSSPVPIYGISFGMPRWG